MAKTIYDVATEHAKTASQEMVNIILGISTDDFTELNYKYYGQRIKLQGMGVWQEGYATYARKILSEGTALEEDKEGLAKLVEGKLE